MGVKTIILRVLAENETLKNKIEQYEKALRFYARKGNYVYSPIDDNIPEVNKDGGDVARKALES
jgi:hypothetical protein